MSSRRYMTNSERPDPCHGVLQQTSAQPVYGKCQPSVHAELDLWAVPFPGGHGKHAVHCSSFYKTLLLWMAYILCLPCGVTFGCHLTSHKSIVALKTLVFQTQVLLNTLFWQVNSKATGSSYSNCVREKMTERFSKQKLACATTVQRKALSMSRKKQVHVNKRAFIVDVSRRGGSHHGGLWRRIINDK